MALAKVTIQLLDLSYTDSTIILAFLCEVAASLLLLASAHLLPLILANGSQAEEVLLGLGVELLVQKDIVGLLEGVFLNLGSAKVASLQSLAYHSVELGQDLVLVENLDRLGLRHSCNRAFSMGLQVVAHDFLCFLTDAKVLAQVRLHLRRFFLGSSRL